MLQFLSDELAREYFFPYSPMRDVLMIRMLLFSLDNRSLDVAPVLFFLCCQYDHALLIWQQHIYVSADYPETANVEERSAVTQCQSWTTYIHQRVGFAESALGELIVSETDPQSLAAQEIHPTVAFYGQKTQPRME